ncbi:nucleotidyl transferase AbiEii/AbiGii toxin family protein [Candidatus Amesbacteria bacterium]|nr:nucleotidyl transferase AbiEii/AbiGii toxin family protein [Candidatus Amesbacteria bacterium]
MAVNYQLQDIFLDKFFSDSLSTDFYLTGGTALARFYFNHRESLDLDLFTNNQKIDFSQISFLANKIGLEMGLKVIQQVTTGTFVQFIFEDSNKNMLKVDLVKDIPVHFGEFKQEGKIRLDSLENMGSNKITAIFGRTDHKDFIDLYYILNETDFTFDHLVSLAKQKDLGLTDFYLANSINQIEQASQMPVLLKPLDLKKYSEFYQELSRKLFLKIKPEDK